MIDAGNYMTADKCPYDHNSPYHRKGNKEYCDWCAELFDKDSLVETDGMELCEGCLDKYNWNKDDE